MSIGLSTDSLSIDNLVPGNISDSNSVKVTVSSNTPYGYVLSASVGSSDSTSTYYNTSNLVHEDSTVNNAFTSIDTSASLANLTTDNTWGYSTSLDGGTTWSTYSGLPSTTTKPLLDISDPATPSTIDFKIAAKSSTTQASGTYNNVITFYAVGKPEPHYLYEEVAKMSKGTQSAADLQAKSTVPTSINYREDTSNSGVYEYDASVFGESSDASNSNKIYYYRGILETENQGIIYDKEDKADAYPNYVRLDNNSCWRIVRTTGSGGVKIIYDSIWTGFSCNNNNSSIFIGRSAFNNNNGVGYLGYTYYGLSTNNSPLSTILGANNVDRNTNSSTIKYSLDRWYFNNLVAYSDILETSAGYCGDRTMYDDSGVLQSESLSVSTLSNATNYKFGASLRNATTTPSPSLTCAKANDMVTEVDRSKVDLYSVAGSNGGNGRLSYPIALLTADEATFSGAHYNNSMYVPSYNSFLNTMGGGYYPERFWLLSPSGWSSSNITAMFYLDGNKGRLSRYEPKGGSYMARPVISLKPGVEYSSGSGTVTDPWIIPAP